jgi:predicted RNA-binding protein with PIN domain
VAASFLAQQHPPDLLHPVRVMIKSGMPYLVDGHNLIPKLGLRLDSFDDEDQLLSRLQEFCRLRRARVEVFFDGAPAGQAGTRKIGGITAHFIRKASSADAAIEARLNQLKKTARNWTVVSSDARLQRAAGAAHAAVLSSAEFSLEMAKARAKQAQTPENASALSPAEVDEWEKIFKQRGG